MDPLLPSSLPLDSITDSAGLFINWLNNVVAERAYSRKLEMEADAVGLNVSSARVVITNLRS